MKVRDREELRTYMKETTLKMLKIATLKMCLEVALSKFSRSKATNIY